MGGCCSGRGNADSQHRRLAPAWYAKHESCSYVSSQEHGEKQPHQTGSCCTAPKEAVVTHCSCAPRCTCYRGARCRQRVTINRAATYRHICTPHAHTDHTNPHADIGPGCHSWRTGTAGSVRHRALHAASRRAASSRGPARLQRTRFFRFPPPPPPPPPLTFNTGSRPIDREGRAAAEQRKKINRARN